jgi:hypothetical protein
VQIFYRYTTSYGLGVVKAFPREGLEDDSDKMEAIACAIANFGPKTDIADKDHVSDISG